MSATKLATILADVRKRADERRRIQPLERLKDRVREDSGRRERFLAGFRKGELAVIAELKRRSPSVGKLPLEPERYASLAQAYQKGGAAALSVLTEEDHFSGTLEDLRAVESTSLPRLRKDFILDEAMVWESCLYGADAVLLLPVALPGTELALLRGVARELGLAVLVEAHDERDLDRALALEPELLGVNARDLATFEVDLATVEALLPLVPRVPGGPIRVAESGIRNLADLRRVRAAGADAVLVGEALVRDGDPEATLRGWKEALRG